MRWACPDASCGAQGKQAALHLPADLLATLPSPSAQVANLRRMLDGEQPEAMKPWYRGFKGTIEEVGGQGGVAAGRSPFWRHAGRERAACCSRD